jgi:hypothetical protein
VSRLYLYALVGDRPRTLGRGLGREPLHLLVGRRFHLVAGHLDGEAPAPGPAALRRHDGAVRRLAGTVEAILPFRFGTVVPDAAAAWRLVEPRAVELAGRLVHVRGHCQMTLRLYDRRRAPAPSPRRRAGDRDRLGHGPGARYLAARGRLYQAESVPELNALRQALDGLVADELIQRHATPPLLASIYHLVPRAGSRLYRVRLGRAAARLAGRRLTVSGPWPPYAFGADRWP